MAEAADSRMQKARLNRLLEEIGRGELAALESLYKELYRPVCAAAYAVLQDRHLAEDAAQDTFVTIAEKIGQYRREDNPFAWVYTIARNHALTAKHKALRESPAEEEVLRDSAGPDNVEDQVIGRETLARLNRLLDETERQTVMLHLAAGLKHREIAGIMNLPLGTVLSKYRRSLKKLRQSEEGERKE